MALFDKFKKRKEQQQLKNIIEAVDIIKSQPYQQKYLEECKFIWRNYVPEMGMSGVVQGELLRELEKIRTEAQENQNINWDKDFEYFCKFIVDTLCAEDFYSEEDKNIIKLIMEYFSICGNYAQKWHDGTLQISELDVELMGYTKDSLYDIIADYIAIYQNHYPVAKHLPENPDINR